MLEIQTLSQDKATALFSIKSIENIAKIEYTDDNELDSDIAGKIQQSVSTLEAYLNRSIVRRQLKVEKSFDRCEELEIDLPFPTHKSIDSVEKWNGTTWETLTSDYYTVTGLNQFTICFNKTWSTKTNERKYRVTYTAGWRRDETGSDALNISIPDSQRLTQAVAEMVAGAYDGIAGMPVIGDRQRTALHDLVVPMSFG